MLWSIAAAKQQVASRGWSLVLRWVELSIVSVPIGLCAPRKAAGLIFVPWASFSLKQYSSALWGLFYHWEAKYFNNQKSILFLGILYFWVPCLGYSYRSNISIFKLLLKISGLYFYFQPQCALWPGYWDTGSQRLLLDRLQAFGMNKAEEAACLTFSSWRPGSQL